MGTIRPFHSASLRLKPGSRAHPPWHALELHSLAAEQNRAGVASTEQLCAAPLRSGADDRAAGPRCTIRSVRAAARGAQTGAASQSHRLDSVNCPALMISTPCSDPRRLRLPAATGRSCAASPINLSRATNPEAGFSSRPSITREVKSGAASYMAPSRVACTVFAVEPQVCEPVSTRKRIAPSFTLSNSTSQPCFRNCGPHPVHCFHHAGFEVFGMEAVKNQNTADQRIAAQPVDDAHSRFAGFGDDVERLLQGRAVQDPSATAPDPWWRREPRDRRSIRFPERARRSAACLPENLCRRPQCSFSNVRFQATPLRR